MTKENDNLRLENIMPLLNQILEVVVLSADIQEKLAENLIYVRDRGDGLKEKIKSISERLSTIEAKIEAPIEIEFPGVEKINTSINSLTSSVDDITRNMKSMKDTVSTSVNSIDSAVVSLKKETKQTMDTVLKEKESEQITQIRSLINKINNEFEALRDLALEQIGGSHG